MMNKAIIKSVSGGIFQGLMENGEVVLLHSPGKIKKIGTLLVGDVVYFETTGDKNSIVEVRERKNEFIRPKAANIDVFLIVQSVVEPNFDRYLIDKLTVYAYRSHALPILLVTKADYDESLATDLFNEYNEIGIKTFIGRKHSNDYNNLINELKGKIVLLVGNSGVGKSTFLNNVHGRDIQETNFISKKLGRGKHTTRQVEIFPIDDFYMIDTPGFSTLELEKLEENERLSDFFPEFRRVSTGCKFKTCTHLNEPGCVVKEKVKSDDISLERYNSYVRLFNELKERGNRW